MNGNKTKNYFITAMLLFILNAATFLIMPLIPVYSGSGNRTSAVIVGAVFWLTFIGATVFVVLSASAMRKERGAASETKQNGAVGIIRFFSNRFATAADIVMICSALCMLMLVLLRKTTGYLAFAALFLLVLSFYMHCMFNGRIFNNLINKKETK